MRRIGLAHSSYRIEYPGTAIMIRYLTICWLRHGGLQVPAHAHDIPAHAHDIEEEEGTRMEATDERLCRRGRWRLRRRAPAPARMSPSSADARAHAFVVAQAGQELKRLPIKGLIERIMPFDAFVEVRAAQAREHRNGRWGGWMKRRARCRCEVR